MEIVRLAEPRPLPSLAPAALALAVLVNGVLLVIFGLTRQFAPPAEERNAAIDVQLVEPEWTAPPASPVPEKVPAPRESAKPAPPSTEQTVPAAPRPGHLPEAQKDDDAEAPPALWSLVCTQIPEKLRDLRPDCRQEGDPFAARKGRVTAGTNDQSIRNRPVSDILGGRFAGKDRYQIEVMLGLRSTDPGTKYHVPVDYGPADEPTDLSNSDSVFGPSPIPDG